MKDFATCHPFEACVSLMCGEDMSCAMLNAMVLAMDGSWNEAAQMTKAHPVLEMQVRSP